MMKTWSNWCAGEEFQRQSTGNQRQNTKRDVSHDPCKSMHGAKGFHVQNQRQIPSTITVSRISTTIP
jgi:hypothetical protein